MEQTNKKLDPLLIEWLQSLKLIRYCKDELIDVRTTARIPELIDALQELQRDWWRNENFQWLARNWNRILGSDMDVRRHVQLLDSQRPNPES